MRASVVINTYNRAESLEKVLQALPFQTCEDFEVIVVNGPSTDATERVLADFDGAVRAARCPEVHLSKSRNIGIGLASGDVVVFIDDDSIPEQDWLTELLAAYDSDEVGGAGGIVFDHTGAALQYRYSLCSRVAESSFPSAPPGDDHLLPGADPFVYLQGTNCSFRRDCLVKIGGFDEEIEYFLDEVEVCMQVLDAGYLLRPLPGAAVHHKYLPSHIRGKHNKVVYNPFPSIKNLFYYGLQHGRRTRTADEVLSVLFKTVRWSRAGAADLLAAGQLTSEQHDYFLRQLERGVEVGIAKGLHQQRRRAPIPPPDASSFLPFPVVRTDGRRRTFGFLSQEYPPAEIGGIGRFTHDLAVGMAAQGHRVHVVTRSPDVKRVDFEDGVWVHRLPEEDYAPPDLQSVPLKHNFNLIARVYSEVARVHERVPFDVVSGPLWLCEGLLCSLDGRFPTVLSLMTSMRTIAEIHTTSMGDRGFIDQYLALEDATANRAAYVHAISDAILEKVRSEQGLGTRNAHVVPLGLRDHSSAFTRRRPQGDDRVRVLFVGRLERRKGPDLFLRAAAALIPQCPRAEFVLVGKDTPHADGGTTYREAFLREFADRPEVLGRITFTGQATEEQLYQHYADADIVCMPSRFESFGLVLVEGMMFGKPVVACAAGGMREIVREGVNGLLAAPEDANALAAALKRLIEDDGLRREFGERSRELFERHYTAEVMVRNTIACYEGVARDHERARGESRSRRAHSPAELVAPLAEVIGRATGLPAESARRYALSLLYPPAEQAAAGPPSRAQALSRKLGAVPVVGPLLRRGKRLASPALPALRKLARLGRKALARVPLLRTAYRYAKHVVLMPRTVHRLALEVREVQSCLDRLWTGQTSLVTRSNELVELSRARTRTANPERHASAAGERLTIRPPGEERKAG